MPSVMCVFFVFILFCCLFSTLRVVENKFSNFLVLTLVIVSLFAAYRTVLFSFYTFFLVGFFVGLIYLIFNKQLKWYVSFSFPDTIVMLSIWSLFAFVYLDFSNFYILHPGNSLDDISVYTRIAYYNDILGVENTRGVYNLFELSPRLEIYHHFELWMMNLGHFFNGANRSMNLLLFVFPVISYLSYLGIKEIFKLNSLYSIAILLIFFLVIWPYDFLVNWLNLGLPRGGGGLIILGIKNVLVLPILLSVIYELRNNSRHFYLTVISLFLYPLLIPIISVSLIIYVFFFSNNSIKNLWAHIGLIAIILGLMLVIPNSHPGFDLLGIFKLGVFLKVVYVSVVTILISFGFYWLLLVRKIGLDKFKGTLLFFSICLIISIGFWLLFSKNLDSNQLFRNLFIPLSSLSIALGIVFFYSKKAYLLAGLGVVIFVLPIMIYGKFKMNHPSDELLSIVSHLDEGDRIMVFPDPNVVNSVFMMNERMFLPKDISLISNFNNDIHFLSTVTLLNSEELRRNEIAEGMIDYYQEISPVFQMCDNAENLEFCIKEFSVKFDFKKALVHRNSPFASVFGANVIFKNYFLIEL